MPRPKQFAHAQTVKLNQLERSLIAFYSHVHNLDSSKVIRSMIRNYVRADKRFDARAYEKFVRDHLAKSEEDETIAAELRQQAKAFVEHELRTT